MTNGQIHNQTDRQTDMQLVYRKRKNIVAREKNKRERKEDRKRI